MRVWSGDDTQQGRARSACFLGVEAHANFPPGAGCPRREDKLMVYGRVSPQLPPPELPVHAPCPLLALQLTDALPPPDSPPAEPHIPPETFPFSPIVAPHAPVLLPEDIVKVLPPSQDTSIEAPKNPGRVTNLAVRYEGLDADSHSVLPLI